MKLIAKRRFQNGTQAVNVGDEIEVNETRGKELLAIGNLVTTPEAQAEAESAKAADETRVNINGGVDAKVDIRAEINPPLRGEKEERGALQTKEEKGAPATK